jgi:hypothetical protein
MKKITITPRIDANPEFWRAFAERVARGEVPAHLIPLAAGQPVRVEAGRPLREAIRLFRTLPQYWLWPYSIGAGREITKALRRVLDALNHPRANHGLRETGEIVGPSGRFGVAAIERAEKLGLVEIVFCQRVVQARDVVGPFSQTCPVAPGVFRVYIDGDLVYTTRSIDRARESASRGATVLDSEGRLL